MEDKLCPSNHGFFIDFEWKDLIKIIRLELLILIPIPQPHFSITTFSVLFLLLWFYHILRESELVERCF